VKPWHRFLAATVALREVEQGLSGWWLVVRPHPAIVVPAAHQPYQKRTKYRRIYRYFRLLALSNLFRTNGRWEDCDRVKMALYR